MISKDRNEYRGKGGRAEKEERAERLSKGLKTQLYIFMDEEYFVESIAPEIISLQKILHPNSNSLLHSGKIKITELYNWELTFN